MNSKKAFILCLICLVSISCADKSFFSRVHNMPKDFWTMGDKASFSFTIDDTTAHYDIFADLRSNDGYPWSNIFIYSSIADTLGVKREDTLKCILCDDLGYPTGHGLSNVKENTIPVVSGYVFPHSGQWTVSFSHGMRNVELQGISSIGIRILKQEK